MGTPNRSRVLWLLLIPATRGPPRPAGINPLPSNQGTLPFSAPRQHPSSDLSESQGQVESQVGPQLFSACDWDGPSALAEQSSHTSVMVGAIQEAH